MVSDMLTRAKAALHEAERERDLQPLAILEKRSDDWATQLARAALLAALDPEDEALKSAVHDALAALGGFVPAEAPDKIIAALRATVQGAAGEADTTQ